MKRVFSLLLIFALAVTLFGAAVTASAEDISFDGLRDIWDPDTSSNYSKANSQATALTLGTADGEGWNGSKALSFSVSDNTNDWANYAQIVPEASDWYGADYLYFYVKNYTGNINISIVSAGTEYKLKNDVPDAAGKWNGSSWDTVKTGSSWFFFQVGTDYTGWLRVKLTAFAGADGSGNSTDDMPASALTSVSKVMFSVSGLSASQYPMTVYFDKFMISGASFTPEDAPAGLRGVWDLDDLTAGTEYMNSYYAAQASLQPVAYGDGLALQWECLNMDWVAPQAVPMKTADFTGASELWFWVDLTDFAADNCRIGVGIGDADGVSYVPGEGNSYNYTSVRVWYYSSAGARVSSALSSWGWIKTLPKNYSGWVGISLTDLAALMADRKLDCTRVSTLYLGLDEAKGNTTDKYIIDNFCINSDPNGLHMNDAGKAVPQKVTVSMPADPTAERNFTWHTAGWAASDLQVVAADSAENADFTADSVLSFEGEIVDTMYGAYVHNAKAVSLTPGEAYCFRVGDASLDVWSDVGCFVTDDADSDFSFIYLSDMQTGTADAKKTLYTLQKAMDTAPDAEFFMNTGDVVNNPGSNSEFLAVLDKDGFFAFGNQTTAIVAGNHEYTSNNVYVDNVLRDHFYFDQPAGSNSPAGVYYSFNYGNIHFVALNANSSMYAELDAAQIAWLKEDLASEEAQNADFRIVMMHRGVFTPGPHYYYYQDIAALTKQLPSVFAEYNVDLVFQGHDHVYALTKQIGADGNARDCDVSTVWSDGAQGYVDAMNGNSDPVYFIGGTAGTKYEPAPVWDDAAGAWTIPATSSNAAGKYTINVSQRAMTEYLDKFQFSETPANSANRSQALFSVVSVTDGQLVVDTYTVDNQAFGTCSYYNSFALDKKDVKDPCEGYTDINRDAWYHAAADYVISRGYMGSTKTDALTFEPNTKVSRAMVASLLYRICGSPAVNYSGAFSDVPDGMWYTDAVEFAARNKLASGIGDGKFAPNANVTRQELAGFLMNLARYLKRDITVKADISGFADAAKVPGWARGYMEWAVGTGLISGRESGGVVYLASADNAVRSELASMIKGFMTK